MIDNKLEFIKNILTFKKEGDFFYCNILKRKKDFNTERTNHQSVRVIKDYCFYSVEDLEARYDEIKLLAETFKARVYCGVNRLNDSQVAIRMIKGLAERLESGNNNCRSLWASTVGSLSSEEKRWVVDLDNEDVNHIEDIVAKINSLEPEGEKVVCLIPTKSGVHIISKPFRVDHFVQWQRDMGAYGVQLNLDIQKLNPSVLFKGA